MFSCYKPEECQKPLVFWCFHGLYTWSIRLKWVNIVSILESLYMKRDVAQKSYCYHACLNQVRLGCNIYIKWSFSIKHKENTNRVGAGDSNPYEESTHALFCKIYFTRDWLHIRKKPSAKNQLREDAQIYMIRYIWHYGKH